MLISIITPCLNRVALIPEAVESVQHQDHPDVEHVVVDGGSTDGTVEVLGQYDHLRVHTGRDEGIYDALDKGIAMSEGEVVGFLNSDDLYESNVLGAVAGAFEDTRIGAAVGGACVFSDKGVTMTFPAVAPGDLLNRATVGAPVFNAWFFRRSLLEELGGFHPDYRYVADRDFLIRIAMLGTPFRSVDRLVYRYRMHPGSVTLSGRESGEDDYVFELRHLAQHHLHSSFWDRNQKKTFLAWHGQIVMEQILSAVHSGGYLRAMRYAMTGLRHDPGLVTDLTSELFARLPGALLRRRQQ
jgi:glycosyltransferase involved in cell wall biosynthesis